MKKQSITLIALAILASSSFFSCDSNKQKQYGNMVFDSISINETAHLFNDTASPACNLIIEYVFPTTAQNTILVDSVRKAVTSFCFGKEYENLTPKAAIDSFKNAYIKDYRTDLESLYEEDKKNNPDRETVGSWYSYYESIDARPLTDNPEILVYKIENSSYTGGAHGMYATNFLNFNIENGKVLRLNDIFKSDSLQSLNRLLLEQLMQDMGVNTLNELQEKAYLDNTDLYPSENFRMGKDSITFFYNVYEIAPYSNGTTEITLPYDKLKNIMNQ